MKTLEETYNEATLKELGENPNGTRMDIIYLAMKQYAKQAIEECSKKVKVTDPYQDGRRLGLRGDTLESYIENNPPQIDKRILLNLINELK